MITIPGFSVVEFQTEHASALVPVWRESFEAAVGVNEPHTLQEQQHYLLEEVVPKNDVLIVLDGQNIVGFIAASREFIAQLYLAAPYQRKGIGGALLSWAKQQSSGRLCLYTFQSNTGAQRFYEAHGFGIIERGFEPEWQLQDIKYEWRAAGASCLRRGSLS